MINLRNNLFKIVLILLNARLILNLSEQCFDLVQQVRVPQNENQRNERINKIYHMGCPTKLIPRYKWGQNMSHIQVKIQFRSSAQTTPCDQILYQKKIINHDMFQVQVLCLHANQFLIDYNLQIKTFKSLDFTQALWKKNQQNSIVLQCLKSPAPYFWPILHSRSIVPGRAPKIWWQMLSLYGPQIRKVIDLLEIGDQDKQISKKVKSKKKKRPSYKKIQFYCNQGSPEHLGSWL